MACGLHSLVKHKIDKKVDIIVLIFAQQIVTSCSMRVHEFRSVNIAEKLG